jgi:hypothetical protein
MTYGENSGESTYEDAIRNLFLRVKNQENLLDSSNMLHNQSLTFLKII